MTQEIHDSSLGGGMFVCVLQTRLVIDHFLSMVKEVDIDCTAILGAMEDEADNFIVTGMIFLHLSSTDMVVSF